MVWSVSSRDPGGKASGELGTRHSPSRLALQLLAQGVALSASRFQVEDEILHIELELVDRLLGDANEPALHARELAHFLAQRQHAITDHFRQLLDLAA